MTLKINQDKAEEISIPPRLIDHAIQAGMAGCLRQDKKMRRCVNILEGIALWCALVNCSVAASLATTTTLTATIVASSCVGEIVTQASAARAGGASGSVDFGVIDPKARSAPTRLFSLRLSETVGGETGCSAFEAYGRQYPVATLTFGDVGQTQLDENGVILRYDDGSDAQLRVQVSPRDAEGVFVQSGAPGYITASHADIAYPVAFAAKGNFDFQAALSQWGRVKPGKFSGALTVTVAYR